MVYVTVSLCLRRQVRCILRLLTSSGQNQIRPNTEVLIGSKDNPTAREDVGKV